MRKPSTRIALAVVATIAILATSAHDAAAGSVALTGGRIVPVVGDVIESGTILIVDGKITAIGADVELPFDAEVTDVTGKTLFPGLVIASTSSGLDSANENLPVSPFVDVYDAIDPSSTFFEDSLRNGVTTIGIHQGNNTVIGGMGRAVRPIGLMVEEMTVAAEVGLKLSMTPKSGFDRMIQAATMREAFEELEHFVDDVAEKKYEEKLKEDDKKIDVLPDEAARRGRELISDDDLDDKHLNLQRLVEGRAHAVFYCQRAMDVGRAIEIATDNGFLEKTTFVLGTEAFKAARQLKATGRPVILDANLTHQEIDPLTGEETETFVPRVFARAEIPFALTARTSSNFGARFLTYQAAHCVRAGIDRTTAIAAITTVPASILGLEDRVGSLEVGKDGNVLVLSGDPLDTTTMVEKVFIDGRMAYDIETDEHLEGLLEGRKADMGGDDAATSDAATSDAATSDAAAGDDAGDETKDETSGTEEGASDGNATDEKKGQG